MKDKFKRLFSIFLALIIVFQIYSQPVMALQEGKIEPLGNLKTETKTQEIKDEKNKTKTIIETDSSKISDESENDTKATLDDAKGLNSDVKKEDSKSATEDNKEINNKSDSNLKDQSQILKNNSNLTKKQMEEAEKLQPGQLSVFKQPKVDYKIGDEVDLSTLEILTKNSEGEVKLLTYEDIISDKKISINFKQGEAISTNYYNSLFDSKFLENETKYTQATIASYLEKNKIKPYQPVLSINIPGFEAIKIDFNIEKEDLGLSPLELFKALKMKNSSLALLSSDKLTYKVDEEIKLDNFRFILKDEKGILSIIKGSEIENKAIKADFSNLKEDKKSFLDKINNKKLSKDKKEPAHSYIVLSKQNYEKLYLPITLITDNMEVKSVDKGSKVESINWGIKLDDKKSVFTYTLDINTLDDLKGINLEFLNNVDKNSSHIKISRIVKTNGYSEEDISLIDPIFRDREHMSAYEDMSTEEIINEMKKLEISNPVDLSNNLEPGYKYVFFIEINNNSESPSKDSKILEELLISTKTKTFDKANLKINIEEQELLEKAISIEEAKSPSLLKVEDTKKVVNKRTENKGSFIINKKDESNQPLINAVFELVDNETGVITEAKSNEEGKVYFDALIPGAYTLREKTAPEGFKKSDMEWNVIVRNDGKTFVEEAGSISSDTPIGVGKDITNSIITEGDLSFKDINQNGNLDINTDNEIKATLNIKTSETVNPGDYFVMEVSDTLHYNMLQPDKYTYPNIISGNTILAKASMDSGFNESTGTNKKVIYTFTEAVKGLQKIDATLYIGQSVNVNVAKNNGTYDFSIKVGSTTISKNITVAYDAPVSSKNNPTLNIDAGYLYTNDKAGVYTQLIYVNPYRKNITGPNTVSIFEDPNTTSNLANISKDTTKITVYRYKDNNSLPNAVILEKDRLEEVNSVTRFENYSVTSSHTVNAANIDFNNIGTDAYVIKVDSYMKDISNAPLIQYAVLHDSDNNKAIIGNGIGYINNSSSSTGEYTPPKIEVINTKLDKTGKFEINKTDENDKPLAGAKFKLTPTEPSGDPVEKISETGTGKVLFDNLKAGKYLLEESEAPAGYKKVETTWTVLVDLNGVTTLIKNEIVAPVGSISASGLSEIPKLRSLLVDSWLDSMRLTALPTGTQSGEIKINNPGTGIFGGNKVTTNAKYLGNDIFEVKLDVTAGPDVKTPGRDTDLVILVQGNKLTSEVKNALIEKLNSYGTNVRVALKIYNPTVSLDKSVNFSTPQTIVTEIRNYTQNNQQSTALAVLNALKSASTYFSSARSGVSKELIHITGIGIDPNHTNVKNAATSLRNSGVKINNYYVGNPTGANVPINYWNKVLGISNTVDATTNIESTLKNTLPSYGGAVQKAIDNSEFNVSFNNYFTFVNGTTNTTKPGTIVKWHSGYDGTTNSIKLNTGELSLNAGETATMTFQVKSASTVTAGQEYKLINDIAFKPNASAQTYTISAPTIQVEETKLKVRVESSYKGPIKDGNQIEFHLKRRVESGTTFQDDPNFDWRLYVDLDGYYEIPNLDKKDANGNIYQYFVTDAKSINSSKLEDASVKITYIKPEKGISDMDGTITIHSEENKGFNISVDWQGLTPVGIVSAFLDDNTKIELTSSNDYFYKDLTARAENKVLKYVTGASGYNFDITGSNGSYTIKVSKASTEIPSITVKNEKAAQLTIVKTDESGDKKLDGAIFNLTGPNGYNKDQTTADGGKAVFTDLTVGEYTLTETKAPDGYEKNKGTWKVVVGADGKVSITPPGEIKTNTTYTVNNKQGQRLTYSSGGYKYNFMDLQAKVIENPNSNNFILKILYKGQDQYYNSYYPLEVTFDTSKFTIVGNNVTNGVFKVNLASGVNNTNGEFNFTITPINPQDNVTLNPLISVKYGGISLASSTYPTITPQIVEIKPQPIELTKTADNTFEYSISNKLAKYNVEFTKIARENPDDLTQDKILSNVEFALYKKDETGKFVDTSIKVKSGTDGLIKITNLVAGEYELHETSTPEGYMPIEGIAKSFKINLDGSVEVKDEDGSYKVLDANNKKIINLKLGTEEFSLIKKDEKGTILKGVEFELRNSNGDIVAKKTTDSTGKIVFDKLPYGKYWLKEIKTLDGYILDSKPIPVLLGKDWTVPKNPTNPRDISNDFIIDSTKTNSIVSTEESLTVVYPNKAEGLLAKVNFSVKEGAIINPGDTFTLKLSDNVDLDGLGKYEDKLFDIMASSGKLAVAKIGDDRRSITYTFTDYVRYHTLKGFKINTPMFINRMAIKNNTNGVEISMGIGTAIFKDTINVNYENYVSDPERVKTYVTKFDDQTGKFTALMYVNPQRDTDYSRWASFWSDQMTSLSSIEVYSTKDTTQNLPWSYGVDFTKLTKLTLSYDKDSYGHHRIYLGNNGSNNAYVIKVEGYANVKGVEFITNSAYYRQYYTGKVDYYGYPIYRYEYDTWSTYLKFYQPDSTTDGKIEFNIVNTKNKIKFIKVDSGSSTPSDQALPSSNMSAVASIPKGLGEAKPMYSAEEVKYLQGAVFQLKVKKDNDWVNYGAEVKSNEKGEFTWEGLPTGEYQVWETKAPEGYILPDKAVSSFIVDKSGNIDDVLNNTNIIPNTKDKMKFYLDKIWKDDESKEHRIEFGTLEFELKAPTGAKFPDNVTVDLENAQNPDRKYKITKVSDDKTTITLEMDLKTAYEGISSETDTNKGIKIIVPSDWASGDYVLKETKAPAGFKIGTETYTINIDQKNRTIKSGPKVLYSKTGQTETINSLKIVNEKGKYPSTGGIGTTMFTALGFLIMAIAVMFDHKKKVINNDH